MSSTSYDSKRYTSLIDEISDLGDVELDEAEAKAAEALAEGKRKSQQQGTAKDREDPAPPQPAVRGSNMTREGL